MEPETDKMAALLGRLMSLTVSGGLKWRQVASRSPEQPAFEAERNGWRYLLTSRLPSATALDADLTSLSTALHGHRYGVIVCGPQNEWSLIAPSSIVDVLARAVFRSQTVLDEALAALS